MTYQERREMTAKLLLLRAGWRREEAGWYDPRHRRVVPESFAIQTATDHIARQAKKEKTR